MTPSPAGSPVATLAARHPEFARWLALYGIARAGAADPAWDAAVTEPSTSPPFVEGARLVVDARAAGRLVHALSVRAGAAPPADALALLRAGVVEDFEGRTEIVAAVGTLAAIPLLLACRRAWEARIPESWTDPACPICGAWAALVEARGLERRLRHRCSRCGADWAAEPVRCPFCDTRDHARLTSLVSERVEERGRVEACMDCRGYLKTVTTLTPCPPDEVGLLDLETVHLDVAAVDHDFRRPPSRRRSVTLIAAPPRGRASRLAALLRGRA